MQHHEKSPSKSSIWAFCSGAPAMWEHAPALFSNSANEGTGAHSLLENCLKSGVAPSFFLGGTIWVDGDEIKIDEEMVAALDQCLAVIKNYRCTWWSAELKINIPQIAEGYYGHADFIAYNETTGKLIIFDFKYGRVPVSPLDNTQILLYAIGACTLPNVSDVNEIELCIVQPRDYHRPIKREFISHQKLNEWCTWLKGRYEATLDPNAPRTAGSHCKYCSGKLQCPEYLAAIQGFPEPPFELSPERIEYLLDILSTIEKAGKDLKQVALNFQQRGLAIPNRKIVRKQTRRKVASEEKLLKLLDADSTIHESEYCDRRLKGIGDLTKLNSQVVKDNIIKPEGGLELVPLNDSRPAVSTASQHFNKTLNT